MIKRNLKLFVIGLVFGWILQLFVSPALASQPPGQRGYEGQPGHQSHHHGNHHPGHHPAFHPPGQHPGR